MMSEKDRDDAGISPESSSLLSFSGASFFVSEEPLQKNENFYNFFGFCILYFLYHKIDLIKKMTV